jgi:serine/threonine protein kinase
MNELTRWHSVAPDAAPLQRLEQLWSLNENPDPRAFIEAAGIDAPADVANVVLVDQWHRWQAGQRVAAEEYLRRFPALAEDSEAALEVVYGEFVVRKKLGEKPRPSEYLDRFPQLAAGLQVQFDLSEAMDRMDGEMQGRTQQVVVAPPQVPHTTAREMPPPVLPDYQILGELGRGGMGIVYKARQISLGRIVALKMIRPDQPLDDDAVQRLLREAQSVAALDHPNIVTVHASGQLDGRPFFTMPYVEGQNLLEHVKAHGLPAPAEAAALVSTLADAVAYANQQGILHRDLKPENVLLDTQGRPRITDFGLACHFQGPAAERLTYTGQLLGTPAYMAVEQALGKRESLGPATDVYGLGGILYFLLTGKAPFRGQSLTEVLALVMTAAPTPPREFNPRVPAGLEAVCLRCLEKDPARRYPSAKALAAALRESGQETQAQPRPPLRARGRSHWLSLGLGAMLCGAVAVALWAAGNAGWLEHSTTAVSSKKPTTVPEPMGILPPERLRTDFVLTVAMLGEGPGGQSIALQPHADGLLRLKPDDEVKFRIKAGKDAYVGVWSVNADGPVSQLFPNENEPDNRFEAGQERLVPSTRTAAEPSTRKEWIWVQASTKPWKVEKGQQEGPFELFKADRAREWARQRRSIQLRPDAALAEAVLWYRVEGRQ